MTIRNQLTLIGITVDHSKKDRLGNPLLIKDGKSLGYFSAIDAFNKFIKCKDSQ